jgi:hypothetical protein
MKTTSRNARESARRSGARECAPPSLVPSHYGRVRKPSRRSLHGPLSTHALPTRRPPVIAVYRPVPCTAFQVPVPTWYPLPASTCSSRTRMTKLPRLPLQVVTQFTISTRCPDASRRACLRRRRFSVPESALRVPACSGVRTNLPNDDGFATPLRRYRHSLLRCVRICRRNRRQRDRRERDERRIRSFHRPSSREAVESYEPIERPHPHAVHIHSPCGRAGSKNT